MLNPLVDKYTIEFGAEFFNNADITKKYNDYLFHLNHPIKNIQDHIIESIQSVSIPGLKLNLIDVNGLNNLKNVDFQGINVGTKAKNFESTVINKQFPGTAPTQAVLSDTLINITFRNTLLNWMYIYENFHAYYARNRKVLDFSIIITLRDSADIPMMDFIFFGCFTADIPGLEFAFNSQFRESKTVEAGFAFNGMTTKFKIPEFNVEKTTIKTSIKDRA